MARPAAAGWMLVTLNDSSESPCSAAFFSLWSAMRASGAPITPSTGALFANDTFRLLRQAGQLGGGQDVRGGCRVQRQWRAEDDRLHLMLTGPPA